MVNFYKKLVIAGKKKYTAVPWLWNEQVQTALKEDGYTLNEDGTVSLATTTTTASEDETASEENA